MADDAKSFDSELAVDAYRKTYQQWERARKRETKAKAAAILKRQREAWVNWNGGDAEELHETAFGGGTI